MKVHLDKKEFNNYVNDLLAENLVRTMILESKKEDEYNNTRKQVQSIVENVVSKLDKATINEMVSLLNESSDDSDIEEYFSDKDAFGKTVKKDDQATYSEEAVQVLSDPVVNREALANDIPGLDTLEDGSARSYLSKVANGKRPMSDDLAKKIVDRVRTIGK